MSLLAPVYIAISHCHQTLDKILIEKIITYKTQGIKGAKTVTEAQWLIELDQLYNAK